MSDSNRRERSKTFGAIGAVSFAVAIGALYCWMFYDMGASASRYSVEQEEVSQANAERAGYKVHTECRDRVDKMACQREIEQRARESQRNEQDLEAQRGMSRWAFWLLVISALQFPATLIALVFVKRTLDATLEAVADTAKATEAMVRQNSLTADAQRAWVTLTAIAKTVELDPNKGIKIEIEITSKNLGQTVARYFDLNAIILFRAQAETDADFNEQIHAQIEAWNDGYTPTMASLLPQDTQIDLFDAEMQGKDIVWWDGAGHTTRRIVPVVLAAALYRTVNEPEKQNISWRSWNLQTFVGGQRIRGIMEDERDIGAKALVLAPHYLSLMHEEHAAHSGSQEAE